MPGLRRLLPCAPALLLAWVAPLAGQRVSGTIRDAERDVPLPFGTAELLGSDGTVLVQTVADGRGAFVTPEMLARRRPARTTDVLTDLAGLQLDVGGAPFERAPTARSAFERGPNLFCFPAVYVDGVRIQSGGIQPKTVETDPFNPDPAPGGMRVEASQC